MKSAREKPTSIRLSSDLLEEIDQICEEEGCSRNDKITNLIENGLNNDGEATPEPIIKEVIKEIKVPVEKIVNVPVEKIIKVPQPYQVEKRVEVPKVIPPEHLPAYTCSQGCNHTNKNYKKRVRSKCSNCDQFNKLASGSCAWCGSTDLDPIDKEELQQLGIPLPNYDNNPSEPYNCPNSNYQCSAKAHHF